MNQQTPIRLDLPYLPGVPGLLLRTWRGMDDIPAMREVLIESDIADGRERATTVEDMRNSYAHLENCDLDHDIIIVEIDGQMAAYGRCDWAFEPTADRYVYRHYMWLVPAARGRGIDAAMLRYFEGRLAEHASAHPDDKPQIIQAYVGDGQTDRQALMESSGYEVITYGQLMNRSLDEPIPDHPLPDGLTMRRMSEDEYERVIRITEENFRGHRGFQAVTDKMIDEWMNDRLFQPDLWMLAWDGDLPVGCVGNFVDDEQNKAFNLKRGWTENISTHKDYRGRGIAKALITESMRMFKAMGMAEVILGVHTENPTGAYKLYQSLGYRKLRGSREYEKPLA